jgi:hypothetical protein
VARIVYVKKARIDQGDCGSCGQPIKAGDSYKHVSLKTGPRSSRILKRHGGCPGWRQSELCQSKMAGVYAAQEGFDDSMPAWDPETGIHYIRDILESAADDIRSVAEEYRESQQNIEQGFGHSTYQSDELGEKADELEAWADQVAEAVDGCEESPSPCEAHEEFVSDCEDCELALETWEDEIRELAEEAVINNPD